MLDAARHHRLPWGLAWLASFACATPPSPEAPESASPSDAASRASVVAPPPASSPAAPTDRTAETSIAPPAVPASPSAPSAAPDPHAPSFDEEMKCRREHCYIGGAATCSRTCYKYNHPRSPEAHMSCNDSCRRNYGILECEQVCALDRRAFDPAASARGSCAAQLIACRKCPSGRKSACELDCVTALRACEAK